jgi:NAD(P)-dependent dehydrogenase (short-subunit alcohol dehydrogenase family)
MTRSVLVTGASRGLGEAIAIDLAAQGHRVAAIQRCSAVPDGVFGVSADVTDPDQVDSAFTRVERHQGPVEVLVSNAGITDDTLLVTMTDEQFTRVVDVNLSGAYRVARRAAPGMLRRRWGRFIFISSIIGQLGSAGQVNYAASKAGLIGLSRSLARELGRRNITSNVIAPGYVVTALTESLDQELKDKVLSQIPTGRYAEPEDIAKVVRFIASEDSAYVNGAVLPVDGGLAMGH